jgi:hypothetical protein
MTDCTTPQLAGSGLHGAVSAAVFADRLAGLQTVRLAARRPASPLGRIARLAARARAALVPPEPAPRIRPA